MKRNGRISWPQAVVSCVAIAGGVLAVIFGPDAEVRMAGAAILGSAVTAGVGAFRGG
jgi:hypothetical protein